MKLFNNFNDAILITIMITIMILLLTTFSKRVNKLYKSNLKSVCLKEVGMLCNKGSLSYKSVCCDGLVCSYYSFNG